jgi:hypothetical protein
VGELWSWEGTGGTSFFWGSRTSDSGQASIGTRRQGSFIYHHPAQQINNRPQSINKKSWPLVSCQKTSIITRSSHSIGLILAHSIGLQLSRAEGKYIVSFKAGTDKATVAQHAAKIEAAGSSTLRLLPPPPLQFSVLSLFFLRGW